MNETQPARVDAKTLLEWMGFERQADCKKALEAQGIAVFNGKNGIWTTLELINLAGKVKMGLIEPEKPEQQQYL